MVRPKVPQHVIQMARELRNRQTAAEEVLWACLRNRQISGAKFRRQHPFGRYIADFYCHDVRLSIELLGHVHDMPDQKQYDADRQRFFKQGGIIVLSFKNEELTENLEGVLAKITESLSSIPLSRGERGQGLGVLPVFFQLFGRFSLGHDLRVLLEFAQPEAVSFPIDHCEMLFHRSFRSVNSGLRQFYRASP